MRERKTQYIMIAIVCLDDKNGMLFNKRRQSQDRLLREDILNRLSGKLWLNPYSASQFSETDRLEITENPLSDTPPGETCFIEDQPLKPYEEQISGLIVYRWNRIYPASLYFDLELTDWELVSPCEFPGHSHEKITREYYQKKSDDL